MARRAYSLQMWTKAALFMLMLMENCLLARSSEPVLSAADIMKRVAEAQDREQKERESFVYDEHIRVATRFKNGKAAREETAEFAVVPKVNGTEKKMRKIRGSYWRKGQRVDFEGEPLPLHESLDGQLVSSFRDDLTNDKSKDGIGKQLFPLTSEEQKGYAFELAGESVVAGRKAYRVRFRPADQHDFKWTGEAIIDQEEFQPVSVHSQLSRRIPFFVRTMLGTDVPGLGFSTQYARVDKNVWFPVSFGTEFRIDAVFFFHRTVTISMESKNFQRGVVDSSVTFEQTPPPH